MPYTVLEKELATLPHAAISEVVDFIRLIKLKFPEDDAISEKKSLFGIWKNEPFYMSPDFDDPLFCETAKKRPDALDRRRDAATAFLCLFFL